MRNQVSLSMRIASEQKYNQAGIPVLEFLGNDISGAKKERKERDPSHAHCRLCERMSSLASTGRLSNQTRSRWCCVDGREWNRRG